jgi:glyoxylase-like metal-dependent hydrolase (beta-lactamase superfamily II)
MATYRFNVGNFDCISMDDLAIEREIKSSFVNAPDDEFDEMMKKYNLNPDAAPFSMNVLLVKTPEHRVLIDTGMGPDRNYTLLANLKSEGIDPSEIDLIFITHGHGDHFGGITDADGKLLFPNARFLMWKGEWEHWTSEATLSTMDAGRAAGIRRNLLPLKDKIELVDKEGEFVPGISAVPAFGHTPCHTAIMVTSNGQRLLHIVDAFHQPFQAEHPEWAHRGDSNREVALATRRSLMERAAREKLLVMAYHIPNPGLGYVVEKDGAWTWQTYSG